MRLPLNLIYSKAKDFDLDHNLVAAICYQESKGFVYAVRFEPNYKYLWKTEKYAKRLHVTHDTEVNLQKQSYGLAQIMGATARWMGYEGSLPALYKPENNLYWMCKYLSILRDKHTDDHKVVASYNAGSPRYENGKFVNQKYVDSVFSYHKELVAG